jgi:hypothetical protein
MNTGLSVDPTRAEFWGAALSPPRKMLTVGYTICIVMALVARTTSPTRHCSNTSQATPAKQQQQQQHR